MKNKIIEDLRVYSYPNNMKETIANVIIDIAQLTKNIHFNKFGKQNGIVTDVILLIKCQVNVIFKDRNYDIPISIIIPKIYPFDPPEFYLDRMQDFCINPKNPDIDPQSLRIFVSSLKNWDFYNKSNIVNVIKEIIYSFNKNFPIYRVSSTTQTKPQPNQQQESSSQSFSSQHTNFQNTDSMKSSSPSKYVSPSSQVRNPYEQQNVGCYSNQSVNMLMSSSQIDNNTLKRIMVEELKLLIEPKIKEEMKKLKQHEEKLNNYRNEFKLQNEKLFHFVDKKEEILEQVNNSLNNIQLEVAGIISYLELNKDKNIDSNNIDEFINISNTQIVNLISLECTIEDFISIFKRLAEKNIINFTEIIRNIRILTREQFKIRYCKDKLLIKKN